MYEHDPDEVEVLGWEEFITHVGARQVFAHAGFEEVSHPTARRAVMRMDFMKNPAAGPPPLMTRAEAARAIVAGLAMTNGNRVVPAIGTP